ncbi:hypothetical protein [Methanorbis furvi]|uniref:Uncharacterized protein n=1 Tax=Methanorbis furvi TaxID=3028299 RepID=A0AAE4S8N4_9EURY|nr:hypothetical protein [Methanocorpusculaceae archaeon Ag1]
MTLEEKITFYSRENAAEFQKYLKEKDCSARISVEHLFSGTPYFEGTIAAFATLIDTIIAKEEDSELSEIKADLLSREKTLTEFFAEHKVGDVLTDATPSQLLAQLETIEANGNEDIQKTATEKFVNSLMILGTLEDNELLNVAGETPEYTLTGIKDPKEMRVMYAYTDLAGITPEDLDGSGITSHIRTSSTTGYVITTGPEIMLTSGIDDLGDVLEHLDVDDDEAGRFVDAIFFKQALIAKIHELIVGGITTEDALLKAFDAPAFPLGDTTDVISFDLTADYLSGVLNDLRKQGFIKGRDGKIKSC